MRAIIEKNMKRIISGVLLVACLTAGCGGSSPPEPSTYDVPSLVGKDIGGVKAVLGPPEDDTEKIWPNGDDENNKEWNKNKKMLLVTFRKNTRKITDFFVGCDSSSGACGDKQHLLQIGNLKEGDARYRIEFVPAMGHPGEFTGVKAVPN